MNYCDNSLCDGGTRGVVNITTAKGPGRLCARCYEAFSLGVSRELAKEIQVVIEVQGGMVQEVYGAVGKYVVVDHDVTLREAAIEDSELPFWFAGDITPEIPEQVKALLEKGVSNGV